MSFLPKRRRVLEPVAAGSVDTTSQRTGLDGNPATGVARMDTRWLLPGANQPINYDLEPMRQISQRSGSHVTSSGTQRVAWQVDGRRGRRTGRRRMDPDGGDGGGAGARSCPARGGGGLHRGGGAEGRAGRGDVRGGRARRGHHRDEG